MALKDDLNKALYVFGPTQKQFQLDEKGRCSIIMRPKTDEKLPQYLIPPIEVVLSPTGRYFTLTSPLAILKSEPSTGLCQWVMHRQFYAEHVSGLSIAIALVGADDLLMAIYHWILETITPDQFSELYRKFLHAIILLTQEIQSISEKETAIIPVTKFDVGIDN